MDHRRRRRRCGGAAGHLPLVGPDLLPDDRPHSPHQLPHLHQDLEPQPRRGRLSLQGRHRYAISLSRVLCGVCRAVGADGSVCYRPLAGHSDGAGFRGIEDRERAGGEHHQLGAVPFLDRRPPATGRHLPLLHRGPAYRHPQGVQEDPRLAQPHAHDGGDPPPAPDRPEVRRHHQQEAQRRAQPTARDRSAGTVCVCGVVLCVVCVAHKGWWCHRTALVPWWSWATRSRSTRSRCC